MAAEAAFPSDDEIVALVSSGSLLETLDDEHDRARIDAFRDRLAALHNGGRIDLLGLTETPEFAAFTGHFFFPVQQVFCDAIPLLNAPIEKMIAAVERLVDKGGNDGAASLPYSAFRLWLQNDLARAESMISSARGGMAFRMPFITGALEALNDVQTVMSFLEFQDKRRHAAVSALGSMRAAGPDEARARFEALRTVIGSDPEAGIRFSAVYSAFSILKGNGELTSEWVPQIVEAVAQAPTDQTRIALLQHVWTQTDSFDHASVEAALALARDGDLSHAGLIHTLGVTLGRLLETEYCPLALDCLTDVLAPEESPVTLDKLASLEHRLATLDRGELFALAVRWFSTGNPNLCETVADILCVRGEPPPFDDNLARFGFKGTAQVVLCHKAVVYLFIHPVVAASFVVAALRAGDRDACRDLMELLAEPILTNYQGEVRKYLRALNRGDAAYSAAREALKRNDTYIKNAEIKTPIKELAPTAYQRSIARIKRMDQHREIHKAAESKSVLASLFHQQVLLYGRKSLIYMVGTDKPPVTMEMQSFSHSMELPQMNTIDPVGLDYLMRVFRQSRPR